MGIGKRANLLSRRPFKRVDVLTVGGSQELVHRVQGRFGCQISSQCRGGARGTSWSDGGKWLELAPPFLRVDSRHGPSPKRYGAAAIRRKNWPTPPKFLEFWATRPANQHPTLIGARYRSCSKKKKSSPGTYKAHQGEGHGPWMTMKTDFKVCAQSLPTVIPETAPDSLMPPRSSPTSSARSIVRAILPSALMALSCSHRSATR